MGLWNGVFCVMYWTEKVLILSEVLVTIVRFCSSLKQGKKSHTTTSSELALH